MKSISVHVVGHAYDEFKSIAARTGRPVAELIREAMAQYIESRRRAGRSVLDIPPHASGALRARWTRTELLDEMLGR
jgi:hypothetical protein